MALPTVADLRTYVGQETTAADGLLTVLLASARAIVEALVRVPITATERTFTKLRALYDYDTMDTVLHVPLYPVESVASLVDDNGDTVPGADYTLDGRAGQIWATGDQNFWVGPYTVTAIVGLTAHPDYDTLIEPRLSAAILLAGADLYHNRNPRASSENAAGAGVGLTADADLRVRQVLGDLIPARGRAALL